MSETDRNRLLQSAREATPSRRMPRRAMTRAELADLVCQHVWEHHKVEAAIDGKYVGRLERGEVRWPNARYRQALREILGVRSDLLLGFQSANSIRTAKELEPVDRRAFLKVGVAIGGVAAVRRETLWARSDQSVEWARHELDAIRTKLEHLERDDASSGGGGDRLKDADLLYRRVARWRNERSGGHVEDRTLSRLQGDIGGWVGWLAYDAGELKAAEQYLSATIVHANTFNLPDIEIRARSYLVLLLNRKGQSIDALRVAEKAQEIAAKTGAPRSVHALLHMRAAAAHAALGDEYSYAAEVDAAKRAFEREASLPDPLWARFVTAAELDGLCGDSLTVLGRHQQAADAFRSMAERLDARYSRNRAYYSLKLADSLLALGDVAEASTQALAVMPEVSSLDSHRVKSILNNVCRGVAPYQSQVVQARELVCAHPESLSA